MLDKLNRGGSRLLHRQIALTLIISAPKYHFSNAATPTDGLHSVVKISDGDSRIRSIRLTLFGLTTGVLIGGWVETDERRRSGRREKGHGEGSDPHCVADGS